VVVDDEKFGWHDAPRFASGENLADRGDI
jgi:hypothetical protein